MTESNQPNTPTSTLSVPAKIAWTVLIAATLSICYFSHLGALGFVGPDEPRYAWIARAMTETGDWVTPRLYGKPWFEKPPLFYWGAAICFKLFGVSEAAARLPSAICALLATLAMAWLAWRMYGGETARWLLLLLPTTVGMIAFSHAAATDMPFSGMLTIAMVSAAVVLRLTPEKAAGAPFGAPAESVSPFTSTMPPAPSVTQPSTLSAKPPSANRTPWLALVLFGFFLGLAVLAKGPAAIILCVGAVFFWALFTKRWRDAFRLLHPAAIVAFCATALPWYILCARRNPEFFRTFIIEHNFKRYLTPEFQHIQPFWYYFPIVLIALLPWTAVLLWSSVVGTLRAIRARRISPTTAFFVSWSFFCLVFFSASQSKLPGYILPAIPPLGILMAREPSSLASSLRSASPRIGTSAGLLLIALSILGRFQSERMPLDWASRFLIVGGLVTLAARSLRPRLAATVCAVVATVAFGFLGDSRALIDDRLSARSAMVAAKIVWNDYSPQETSTYRLTRSFQYGLSFYFHRELPEWSVERSSRGWVFALAKQESELRELGLSCPLNALRHAVIVCEDPGLVRGRDRSGQPQ